MIGLIVEFHFKAESIEKALSILSAIVQSSQTEQGCLFYRLFKDDTLPQTYFMMESWQTYQDWQSHMNSKVIQAAREAIQPYLKSPIVLRQFSGV